MNLLKDTLISLKSKLYVRIAATIVSTLAWLILFSVNWKIAVAVFLFEVSRQMYVQ